MRLTWEGGAATNGDHDEGDAVDAAAAAGLGFLLARAGGRAIRAFNRALQPYGLRSRHYTVLLIASGSGGCSQRDLGETLGIDPSAVVSLVDDLERSGLVRRGTQLTDRRTRLVTATPEGQTLLDRLRVLSRGVDDELIGRVPPGEREDFLRMLRLVAFEPPSV